MSRNAATVCRAWRTRGTGGAARECGAPAKHGCPAFGGDRSALAARCAECCVC